MPKDIVVVVKNKLMSTDTVIPILIELKEKYNVSSLLITNDELAHKGINSNVVLRDAIKHVGKELYIGGGSSNKILKKIFKIRWFVFLFYKLSLGTKVLHFGIFHNFPYSILARWFCRNLYFLQSDSFKHSYEKISSLTEQTRIVSVPITKNIVAFNDGMRDIDVLTDKHKLYMFGHTRTRGSWINYIKKRSDNYFDQYHRDVDLSNGCITLILSYFGFLPEMRDPNNSAKVLFIKTIEVLNEVRGNIPVLIKPHVFTDMKFVNDLIVDADNMYITYLHPTILALNSRCFIANAYSTTLADANSVGVVTLEYTDYSESVLEETKGKSLGYEYVDYFINNDLNLFKETLQNILLNTYEQSNYQGHTGDPSCLLVDLSK